MNAAFDATSPILGLRWRIVAQFGLTAELARRALPLPPSKRKQGRGIAWLPRRLGASDLALAAASVAGVVRDNPASPLARYRRALASVRQERGERCEACGVPARSAHHVVTVGLSGIAFELVHEPTNQPTSCCSAMTATQGGALTPGSKPASVAPWPSGGLLDRRPRGRDRRPSRGAARPRPQGAPRQALRAVYEHLLAVEQERLTEAVRIERERKIVFPETSVIVRDVRYLVEKLYGGAEGAVDQGERGVSPLRTSHGPLEGLGGALRRRFLRRGRRGRRPPR